MSRSDRGGRVGEYGHEVSILSRPPAILWFLSHRLERNSPRRAKPSCNRRKGSITAPSSAPFGGTFPPGGRLKKSRRRNAPKKDAPPSEDREASDKLFSAPPGLRVVGETQEVVGGHVVMGANQGYFFWSGGDDPVFQNADLTFFNAQKECKIRLSFVVIHTDFFQTLAKNFL